jgi:hypothetical protein
VFISQLYERELRFALFVLLKGLRKNPIEAGATEFRSAICEGHHGGAGGERRRAAKTDVLPAQMRSHRILFGRSKTKSTDLTIGAW